ncbi:hypothetical protein N2152v2_001969 [Parachlorella kessleri]
MHRRAAASLARVISTRVLGPVSEQAAALGLARAAPAVALLLIGRDLSPWAAWGPGQASSAGSRAASSSSSANQPPQPPPSSSGGSDAAVINVQSVEDFQAVLSLSQQAPVVLDLWATWCGPCKQLDPVLKSVVAATKGAVKLAKLDIDLPAVAPLVQQMNVASVPTMFLLFGGRMLDAKVGVPSQQELRSWVAEAVALAEQQLGRRLGAGDTEHPEGSAGGGQSPQQLLKEGFAALERPGVQAAGVAPLFGAVLQQGEEAGAGPGERAQALAGLAMCALIDDPPALDTARDLVANAKEAAGAGPVPDQVSRAEALIELASDPAAAQAWAGAGDPRSLAELQQAVESDPGDLEARYALALRLFAAGRHAEAVEAGLALVRKDRDWREQAGKKLLLRFFSALGADSELAKSGRRRLSNYWFI